MKFCKRCVMSDQRPNIKFDKDGVCYPCRASEHLKKVDWKQRWVELEHLAEMYRGRNGDYYDCIIAASGGKDSWYQTYIFKERLGMNPLIVSIDNYSWTNTGRMNWDNLKKVFGVDSLMLSLNPQVFKNIAKQAFDKYGFINWYWDRAVYAFPLQMAYRLNIPLVVYGEDTNFLYGGPHAEETPSAKKQLSNDVVKPFEWDEWGVDIRDVNPGVYPENLNWVDPIFLSYFVPWDGYQHMEKMRKRGFKTLNDTGEWKREGYIDQYAQIDTIGYLVNKWLMFPKFGHQRTTEVASLYVRDGRMTRDDAVEKVLSEDWKLDRRMLDDFLSYTGFSEEHFWEKVDEFANRSIVEKRDGNWRLKPEVEKLLRG